MDAALDAFSRRLGTLPQHRALQLPRLPFTAATMSSAAAVRGIGYVMGAPKASWTAARTCHRRGVGGRS